METTFSFEEVVVPHLTAGYRLARWLMRDNHDAEDVVQDAALRAFRYFQTFAGGNGRAWFLTIVRNTCHVHRRASRQALSEPFEEEHHTDPAAADPEALLSHVDDATRLERALRGLPDRFCRLLILRELEGLSYRQLAEATGVPIGTVMSRLSRARQALRESLHIQLDTGPASSGVHLRGQGVDSMLV
jgi:RNA polymerase sigma-70 factor, ECF subfamily